MMASPVEIAANWPPETQRDSKRPKLDEAFPDENKQVAVEDSDSDDDYDLDDYDGDEVLMNQYKLMYKQARRSEGFYVTTWPSKAIPGAAVYTLIDDDRTPQFYAHAKESLAYAIEEHNTSVKDDEKIELLDIVRTHAIGGRRREYFITINARLISTGEHKVYQVRVIKGMASQKKTVVFVRPKPGQ